MTLENDKNCSAWLQTLAIHGAVVVHPYSKGNATNSTVKICALKSSYRSTPREGSGASYYRNLD